MTARTPTRKTRLDWIIRGGIAYPWAWLTTVYATWLIACATLGRRPRPLLDDPKLLGTWVELAHTASLFSFLFALPALLAALVAAVLLRLRNHARWGVALLWFAAVLVSWFAAGVYVRSDPGRVIAWFGD